MRDSLLNFYQNELAFIRQAGAEFAKNYPKIAGHLRIDERGTEDPHVARLIEAIAFMNARIQHKLEDGFPHITEALLDNIGSHYERPFPSLTIVQMQPQADCQKPFILPRHTPLETFSESGERYSFQTCYETTILPVYVSSATLLPHHDQAPLLPKNMRSGACLKISLNCLDNKMTFAKLAPKHLRFYLKGQTEIMLALYDLIFTQAVGLAIANQKKEVLFLEKTKIKMLGLRSEEEVLPYSAQTLPAHRLLTEYFAYPDKFRFVDIELPEADRLSQFDDQLNLFIYFEQAPLLLQNKIAADSFALNCTPIVNLFRRMAEPVVVNHTQYEYPLMLDNRKNSHLEVYKIDEVTAIEGNGETKPMMPLHGMKHGQSGSNLFWQARRTIDHSKSHSQTVLISPIDLDLNLNLVDKRILQIAVTCFNRQSDGKPFFDANLAKFQLPSIAAPVKEIRCLISPSPVIDPKFGNDARLRLNSQLSLNHSSLMREDKKPDALQEVLRLHLFNQSAEYEKVISSIKTLTMKPAMTKCSIQGIQTFCQGLEITIDIDESGLLGNSIWLFTSVLEQFLQLSVTLNVFTQLTVTTQDGRRQWHRFQPRIGKQYLI